MNKEQDQASQDLTFSQRHGYEPLPEPVRPEEISGDLRREIWDAVRDLLSKRITATEFSSRFTPRGRGFVERVLGAYTKKPRDEIPTDSDSVMRLFKAAIFGVKFNDIIDLLEIMVNDKDAPDEFVPQIKGLFERYAAYRLDTSQPPYRFFPCASKEQCDAIQQAIETVHDGGMTAAAAHLREAGEHIKKCQYGVSIAASIHAVESVARLIGPGKNNTLGPALDSLEKAGLLKHTALKEGFKKLYGYTCDEQGICHALLDRDAPDVSWDEALFMLGACASFAAYLVSKHQQIGQQVGQQEEDSQ